MQFSSTIVEVAIGLALIYIGLSLLASWINETIAAGLNLRGKGLTNGIRQMLGDARLENKLFRHPILASSKTHPERTPSYISASQFATALLDVIRADKVVGITPTQAFQGVQNALATTDEPLKTALTSIVATAAGDYTAVVNGIEGWFNDTMNRVSGAYRRGAMVWIFFIAIVLASGLDADSVKFVKMLEWNSSTRAALVTAAGTAAKEQNASAALAHVSTTVFNSLALGWFGSPSPSPATTPVEPPWQIALGLLGTVLAISLGAPFWFDTLKFLMNVRSAGTNPSDH
jgi:hypothetical protein